MKRILQLTKAELCKMLSVDEVVVDDEIVITPITLSYPSILPIANAQESSYEIKESADELISDIERALAGCYESKYVINPKFRLHAIKSLHDYTNGEKMGITLKQAKHCIDYYEDFIYRIQKTGKFPPVYIYDDNKTSFIEYPGFIV